MNYIYIDESGDLGNQTDYFVMAAIIVDNPKYLERIITKIRRLHKKELGSYEEVKGHQTPNSIIKKYLKK